MVNKREIINIRCTGFNKQNCQKVDMEERSTQDTKETSSTKSLGGSSFGSSISEIAGQRLYENALKTRKKIEDAKKKKLLFNRQLKLPIRQCNSLELNPCSVPRYLKLYEHSKVKKTVSAELTSSSSPMKVDEGIKFKKETAPKLEDNDFLPARAIATNDRCNLLYGLSKTKQQKGKQRRDKISSKHKHKLFLPYEMNSNRLDSYEPKEDPAPRYLKLYEEWEGKKEKAATLDKNDFLQRRVMRKISPNKRCNVLYELSKPKQQEGKERREKILQSKYKPPPHYLNKTISVDEAVKLYHRGMKHLENHEMNLKMKRKEAAGNYTRRRLSNLG